MKKQVPVVGDDGDIFHAELLIKQHQPWSLHLKLPNGDTISHSGNALPSCLDGLQAELVKVGCRLSVNGLRKNAFVSGMSMSMSGGRKAYLVTLGSKVSGIDLVDIFDPADPSLIVSAEERKQFSKEWIESTRISR